MIFYIHYILMTSGLSGTSVLLGVFFKTYTDASQGEIGVLLMSFPFVSLIIKPLFCSMADRRQAHKHYMMLALIVELLGYAPFAVIPFFPQFYENHPRAAWYILIIACHVGNGGLGVGWSLGDCLAVNMSQKNGTPFGRMRLMGTVSWGVYGFIIGQVNEIWFLPKYVPAFFILLFSLAAEVIIIFFWNDEDFEMVDPLAGIEAAKRQSIHSPSMGGTLMPNDATSKDLLRQMSNYINSTPSSLGGTLRLSSRTAGVMQEALVLDDLQRRLAEAEQSMSDNNNSTNKQSVGKKKSISSGITKLARSLSLEAGIQSSEIAEKTKNPQLILLKLILIEDGRLIKYIILFTIFGVLIAPMNFVFISMEEISRDRGYNFSQLAGAVLISQAGIETVVFMFMPWFMERMSRSLLLLSGLLVMVARYGFYAGWYYTADISPYWAVLSEWGIGVSYGIACTIQAEVALMFANQSRLFIPELRRLGFLSDERTATRQKVEAEEQSVKMALRATLQALFDGFMSGLGYATGALLCGVYIELYSYITLWKLFTIVSLVAAVLHQLVELTKSRWSDTYKPCKGTKAYEIMQLSKATAEQTTNKMQACAH